MRKYRIEFIIKSPASIKKDLEKIIEAICSLLITAGVTVFGFIHEEE